MAHTRPPAAPEAAARTDRPCVGSSPCVAVNPEQSPREPAPPTSDDRFRRIFDAVPGMVCVLSPAGDVELLNEQVLKYFGRTFGELKDWAMTDVVHPDDLGAVVAAWKHSLATGEPFETEQRQRRADGVYRWQQSRASPVRDAEGHITAWYMLITDIDDLRRTEAGLQQSQAYLKEAQRLSRTGSFGWKVTTDELIWSEETFRILGYSSVDHPTLKMVYDRVHPTDRARVQLATDQASRDRSDIDLEHRLLLPDGTIKHVHVVARAAETRSGTDEFVGALMDITERQRTTAKLEQALARLGESEAQFRGMLTAMRRILDSLAHESSPDRMIEHVLRTMTEQLGAHSCSVWSKDPDSGLLHFKFALVQGEFRTTSDTRHGASFPADQARKIWPAADIFNCGEPQILEDVREGPDFPWRSDLLAQGIVTVLVVPMLVAAQVQGIVGIRFVVRRSFQPEELQLAQTLANQAMLAMQLSRISAQSRRTAVLAERNRMARDIHDTLAQGFTGVIVQLEAAADATARGLTAEAADHVQRAGNLARESLQDARRSVRALRPLALAEQDLPEALDDMLRKMTAGTTLRTRFQVIGTPRALPLDREENLLRITQEVLTNSLRHAHATEFAVQLMFADDEIRLELRDNGRGFDEAKRSDGFGLLGIRERTEQMGGKLTVTTAAGQGTITLIVLPLVALPNPHLP